MTLNEQLKKAQSLLDNGEVPGAIKIFKNLLPYFENDTTFLNVLGTSYFQINEIEKGIEILKRAYSFDPKNVSILYNLGMAYIDRKDFIKAKKYLSSAVKYDSGNILILSAFGKVLTHFGKFDKARNLFLKVLKINPSDAIAHSNLGLIYMERKDYLDAFKSFDRAISLDPSYIDVYWNKAYLKLLLGELEEGWKLYESRLQRDDLKHSYKIFDESKSWRGEKKIAGKTLLIFGEQGFGDVIQFSRYIPLLDKFNCKTILYVKKELVNLLETLGKSITVIGMDKPAPMHDFHCPIMSLPYVFKTDISNIPNRVPYLSISKAKKSFLAKRTSKPNIKKIGIVFSGSTNFKDDRFRSIDFKYFETFFKDVNSVEFHSLMVEYRDSDKEHIKKSNFMISHEKELIDFSDTAALISSLDLVISIDSAVAHLAGAMNKPVWILIPHKPDFRWMLDTSDSFWYPSAKLFRQNSKEDWSQPLKEINLALKDFVKAGTLDS